MNGVKVSEEKNTRLITFLADWGKNHHWSMEKFLFQETIGGLPPTPEKHQARWPKAKAKQL
jgi:hypothetical protein